MGGLGSMLVGSLDIYCCFIKLVSSWLCGLVKCLFCG